MCVCEEIYIIQGAYQKYIVCVRELAQEFLSHRYTAATSKWFGVEGGRASLGTPTRKGHLKFPKINQTITNRGTPLTNLGPKTTQTLVPNHVLDTLDHSQVHQEGTIYMHAKRGTHDNNARTKEDNNTEWMPH